MRAAMLLPLVLAACAAVRGGGDPASELARNRRLWESRRIADYRYTVQLSCFCPESVVRPVQVEVRGGVVTARTYAGTSTPADPASASAWPRVEGLFDQVARAIARGADEIAVEYDARLGYPTRIRIDPDRRIADEETMIRASGLEAIR